MYEIVSHLQQCLTRFETVCIHICVVNDAFIPIHLFLFTSIPTVPNSKFLGLTMDSKYFFIPHIEDIANKCKKSLDIIRVFANTNWDSHRNSILTVYRCLVRSNLDYASAIYKVVRHTYIWYLNTIENTDLRFFWGAFRSSSYLVTDNCNSV